MDKGYEEYIIRAGSKSLHDLSDEQFIKELETMIQATYPSFSAAGVTIDRHLRRLPNGDVDRQSLNYTLSGVHLTYRQIRGAFYDKCANIKFGYPDKVGYRIKIDWYGRTTPDAHRFYDQLRIADGLTDFDEIPVVTNIVEDSVGWVRKVEKGRLLVPEFVVDFKILQRCSGYRGSVDAPKSEKFKRTKGSAPAPDNADLKLQHVRFDSQLQAYNAAYELVHDESLYEKISHGNVVKVVDFTVTGKKFFSLDRFDSVCFRCGHDIVIYAISIDLDFVLVHCGCDDSKSCFLWPGENMVRYRLNKHLRKALHDDDEEYEGKRLKDADNLIRMIPPVRPVHESPLEYMNSTVPNFMSELQFKRREIMSKNRTKAKIMECIVQNLNAPKPNKVKLVMPTDDYDEVIPQPMPNTDDDLGSKYNYYSMEVEVDKNEFWCEEEMINISNVKLRELLNGSVQSHISDQVVKNKRIATGSWIAASSQEASDGKFRFCVAVRITKKGPKLDFAVGQEIEVIPVMAQYRKFTLKKLGNRWQRYFTRIRLQNLNAETQIVKEEVLDPSAAIAKKVVTFKAYMDRFSSSKLEAWNPDMSKTYVGFTAKLTGRYMRKGESALEDQEFTGRVLEVHHGEGRDRNGMKIQQVSVLAAFSCDVFWKTQIENPSLSTNPIPIRFWEDVCLTDNDAASLPCGIPAGAEGTLKTLDDYEDDEEDEYYDDFSEQANANAWLDRSDDPDIDTSNINGEETFRRYKSQKVVDYEKTCPIVNVKKHTRLRLPPVGTTPEKLHSQMRWEKGDDSFPFLRFLLKDFVKSPRPGLHVKDLNLKEYDEELVSKIFEGFNPSQLESARKADHLALSFVVGPPGTGKTLVGSGIVAEFACKEKGPCLVMSSSNYACDQFYRSLAKLRDSLGLPIKVIRMLSRKQERYPKDGIEYLHDLVQEDVKNWKPELQDAYAESRKKGSAMLDPRIRKQLVAQTIKSSVEALKGVDIVVSTVASATDGRLNGLINLCRKNKLRPPVLAIDECSRITMADIMPLMCMDPIRMLLLGDDSQLPPIVQSVEASMACLDVPWMRFIRTLPYYEKISTMLNETYRLTPRICSLISNTMYGGKLKPAATIYKRDADPEIKALHAKISSVFDRQYSPGESIRVVTYEGPAEETNDLSTWNNVEIEHVLAIIKNLVTQCGVDPKRIMCIAMYAKQVAFLQTYVRAAGFDGVRVCTVDGSQGMESDIIILSQVRSNLEHHIGFLQRLERLNVALSRSKFFLFWVMDYDCFKRSRRISSETYTHALNQLKVFPRKLKVEINYKI